MAAPSASPAARARRAADDLRVDRRAEWPLSPNLTPVDPAVASAGDVVVYGGNIFIEVSLTGGAPGSFSHIPTASLTTTAPDGGYRGDSDVVYDRATDLFYWIDQSICTEPALRCGNNFPASAPDAQGENRYRLFVADPDDLKKSARGWLFWDLRSSTMAGKRKFMDYPSLALGQGALYLAANTVHPSSEVLMRIKTAQIRANYNKWNTGVPLSGLAVDTATQPSHTTRPVQDVGTTGYFAHYEWGGEPGASKVTLIVQSVTESSPFAFTSSTLPLTQWSNEDASSSPDGKPLNFTREWVPNGTLVKDALWFAWGIGRRRPTSADPTSLPPRIRITRVSASTMKILGESDGGVPGLATGFPSLATNVDGEVGMVFVYGGEGLAHSQTAVALLMSPQRVVTFAAHSRTSGQRLGDYYKIHRDGKDGRLFSAGSFIEGAGLSESGDFIRFGRGDPTTTVVPDLKATAITRDTYTISNLSNAVIGPFSVRATITPNGGKPIVLTLGHGAGIGPLASVSAYLPACFSGSSKATIFVDPSNSITESNEANNVIAGGPWSCIK